MHAVVCRSDKYTHITWQVIQGSPGRVHQDENPRVAGKRCFRCVCLVRSWRLHLLHASACARPIASLPRTCELPHARCARRSSAGTGRSDGFLQWLNPLPVQSVAHGAGAHGLCRLNELWIAYVRSGFLCRGWMGAPSLARGSLVHKGRRSRVCKPVKGNVACSRDFAFACLRRGEFANPSEKHVCACMQSRGLARCGVARAQVTARSSRSRHATCDVLLHILHGNRVCNG